MSETERKAMIVYALSLNIADFSCEELTRLSCAKRDRQNDKRKNESDSGEQM